MNHLDKSDARLALTQFFMECESSNSGKWLIDPVDANVEKIFLVTGEQKNSWFIRRVDNFLNMYFADYIYSWLSQITVAYIGINWVSDSIDIYFGVTDNGVISTFGIRFPLEANVIDKLEGAQNLQFALAPRRIDKDFTSETTGIAIQIRHILEGED